MKSTIKLLLLLAILSGIAYASYQPAVEFYRQRNRVEFRVKQTEEGTIIKTVNATGTVQPVLSVHVGSFVSGPIEKLHVDFNDEVLKDQLLAEIDPRIYEASVARDRAALATRKADLARTQARLQNAINDEKRAFGLSEDNEDFISKTELDQFKFARMALEAEILVAEASIEQADANLNNSLANLAYTEIRSPVDGVVIDRKIDPGQTLAAQFQTPELFIIAPDLRKEMHIFASVDEADIGLIRQAQEAGQKVQFTVDAYPGELFEGEIFQIRLSSTTTQNVVTYPVVISTTNEDLKLLPGMTTEITFQIEQKDEIVKIPNAALRYYPKREHVRKEDHPILDGTSEAIEEAETSDQTRQANLAVKSHLESKERHVWVKDGELLRAVQVTMGISDYEFTELLEGELKVEQELVIGVKN